VKTVPASIPSESAGATTVRDRRRRNVGLSVDQLLAQIDHLKDALALSHQDGLAARQQLNIFKRAAALLPETPIVEHDSARDRHPNLYVKTSCLSAGLDPEAMRHLERLLARRHRFRKGDPLYHVGATANALFAIQTGSCKTSLIAKDGQEQICGHYLAGDIIGIDGLGNGVHDCQAVALEDVEGCWLSFDRVDAFAEVNQTFRHNLNNLLSQDIVRGHAGMLILGSMHAEQRLAAFLLDLSERYKGKGYSSSEFLLRLTREEIGSLLGLKLETVSRVFSRFQRNGIVQVEGRLLKLLDLVTLDRILECGFQSSCAAWHDN